MTCSSYEGAQSTWDYWGPPISDGFFSWDSVWPVVGAKNDGDITRDLTVQAACIKNDMSYMMGKNTSNSSDVILLSANANS